MATVKKIDPVIQLVQQSVRQFGLTEEGPMGQQILLLGDTFYGYRFTTKGFTAVWSVADQTLNIFDQNGRRLGVSMMEVHENSEMEAQGAIKFYPTNQLRKAA